jgi:hypothetical protein
MFVEMELWSELQLATEMMVELLLAMVVQALV